MKDTERFVEELNAKFPKVKDWDLQFAFSVGKRFDKVYTYNWDNQRNKSVYAFIEKSTGDVYKPASWNAPAKHVRGNINDADVFTKVCNDKHGITYLPKH